LNELRQALELATEDELKQLTQILFSRRLNPLDYLNSPQPIEIQSQNWSDWIDSLERRFRFLAADGITVLRGKTQQVSYRQALIGVCHYLKVPYSQEFSTTEIEVEIFLHLAGKAWKRMPNEDKQSVIADLKRSLAHLKLPQTIATQLENNPVPLLVKGSGIIAVSSLVTPLLWKQIARQFALHFASYQAAKNALVQGGTAVATCVQSHLALQGARRGLAMTVARQGAARSVLAFVGPLLWGYFLVDLSWRSIATNYSRIIPSVFAIAQIRLIRSHECWEFA